MKKVTLFLLCMLLSTALFSQNSVNADGTLKFRGNVAIIVEGRSFTFQDGRYIQQVDDEVMSALKTTLRTLIMQKFQDVNFAVVNRDNDAFEKVSQLLHENKLEDYLDGISISAKNQGADYLFLVDITNYGENNEAAQFEISTRLINVENNMGYHTFYRSDAIVMGNETDVQKKVRQMIHDFTISFEDFLLGTFPEQYYIAKADGKTWYLGAYQPTGRILPSDKFYAFKFSKENMEIGQTSTPVQVLKKVATCTKPTLNGGYLQVTSDKTESNTSDIVLFRNNSQPAFQGVNQITVTFFGLDYDNKSYDGLAKNRINNAIFSAITRHPGLQLIEHDLIKDLQAERELQKSEDFIDGHVVEQMKAIGAQYLIHLESYGRDNAKIKLKLSLISVDENRIIKSVDIITSIDNIENEMYKQICDRISNYCTIKPLGKNNLEMTSIISLAEGDDCILSKTKEIHNPITGEVSYSNVDLCKATVKEYT